MADFDFGMERTPEVETVSRTSSTRTRESTVERMERNNKTLRILIGVLVCIIIFALIIILIIVLVVFLRGNNTSTTYVDGEETNSNTNAASNRRDSSSLQNNNGESQGASVNSGNNIGVLSQGSSNNLGNNNNALLARRVNSVSSSSGNQASSLTLNQAAGRNTQLDQDTSSQTKEINSVSEGCAALYDQGTRESGVYAFQIKGSEEKAYCMLGEQDNGWTAFSHKNANGELDFAVTFSDYENGFGKLENEFFLGLKKLNEITSAAPQKLRVRILSNTGNSMAVDYGSFKVESSRIRYILKISKYVSNNDLGNILDCADYSHNNMPFSAGDRDSSGKNCAVDDGGFWYPSNCGALHPFAKVPWFMKCVGGEPLKGSSAAASDPTQTLNNLGTSMLGQANNIVGTFSDALLPDTISPGVKAIAGALIPQSGNSNANGPKKFGAATVTLLIKPA